MDEVYREGKIILLEGAQRTGKTLGMSTLAADEYVRTKAEVLTNIAYENPITKKLRIPYKPLNFFELTMEKIDVFRNRCITIDELNFYVGQRTSMTKVNRRFCQYLLQSKKMGINTYGTTHNIFYLDLMIRENFDYLVTPTTYYQQLLDPITKEPMFNEMTGEPIDIPAVLILKWINGPNQSHFRKTQRIDFREKPHLLNLYNSRHVFNPFAEIEEQMQKEKEQKRNRINTKPRLKDLVPDYLSQFNPEGLKTGGI